MKYMAWNFLIFLMTNCNRNLVKNKPYFNKMNKKITITGWIQQEVTKVNRVDLSPPGKQNADKSHLNPLHWNDSSLNEDAVRAQ